MAKLNLINSTSREEYEVDVDFSTVTPKDILSSSELGLPEPPARQKWQLLKGSQVVEESTPLDKLGFKDGDNAEFMAKVQGA